MADHKAARSIYHGRLAMMSAALTTAVASVAVITYADAQLRKERNAAHEITR